MERVDPRRAAARLIGTATDLAVDAVIAGTGTIYHFEDWLRPHLDSGALEPILEAFTIGAYYPGRRLVPPPRLSRRIKIFSGGDVGERADV